MYSDTVKKIKTIRIPKGIIHFTTSLSPGKKKKKKKLSYRVL